MTTDLYSKPTISTFHPVVAILSTVLRVSHSAKPLGNNQEQTRSLRHHLMRRGYNDKAIESGFSRASEINRNNLLALTYHPSLEKI